MIRQIRLSVGPKAIRCLEAALVETMPVCYDDSVNTKLVFDASALITAARFEVADKPIAVRPRYRSGFITHSLEQLKGTLT